MYNRFMETTTLAILYSLVPLFGFGISNAMQKTYAQRLGSAKLITYRGIAISVMLFVILILNLKNSTFDLKYLIIAIIIAAISYFGLYFLNKGLEVGKVGLVVPLSSGRVLITALVGALFLGERLGYVQLLFIILIFLGVVLSSINLTDLRNSQIFDIKSGIPYAILVAFFWGVTFPLFGIPVAILGVVFFSFILETTVTTTGIAQLIIQKKKISLTAQEFKDNYIGIGIIAILGVLASIFMNLGYGTGHVSIVTAISAASPVVSAIMGVILYKESLNVQQ